MAENEPTTQTIEKITESKFFNPTRYLDLNLDVKAAVERGETTAIEHFATFGLQENRRFSLAFDSELYLSLNIDAKAAVERGETTALEHLF
ncbi:MAG: hypothetical protein J7642_05750 [Cyanobacteria bacterium SBC]|nr:hypothetical protein [Cyanobacteria bacterium SBC]